MAVQIVPVGSVYPSGFIPTICGTGRVCGDGSICGGFFATAPIGPTIIGTFIIGDGHKVGGTPLPQFGTPTLLVSQNVTVAVGGVPSAQAFGKLPYKLGGVSSAQAFGVPRFNYIVKLAGVPSAQVFGVLTVYRTYLHPSICEDLTLTAAGSSDLVLVAAGVTTLDLDPEECL